MAAELELKLELDGGVNDSNYGARKKYGWIEIRWKGDVAKEALGSVVGVKLHGC